MAAAAAAAGPMDAGSTMAWRADCRVSGESREGLDISLGSSLARRPAYCPARFA